MKQALTIISLLLSTNSYSQSRISNAITENDYDAVVDAIDSIADINIRVSDYYGSPLQLALGKPDVDLKIIELLLEQGADPQLNLTPPEECYQCAVTPIQLAIKNKNYAALALLINRNVNLDSIVYDYAPIHYAVYEQDTAAIGMLMSHNVNVYAKDIYDNGTPIEMAVKWSYDVSLEYLLKNGVKVETPAEDLYLENMQCCGDGFGQSISNDMRLKTITILYESGIKPTEKVLRRAEDYRHSNSVYYDYFRSKGLIAD